jgi:hypothetical protein
MVMPEARRSRWRGFGGVPGKSKNNLSDVRFLGCIGF